MSFEYSNGADGSCQECGEPTEEEHHALCMDCCALVRGMAAHIVLMAKR